jgi:hypothetical protein
MCEGMIALPQGIDTDEDRSRDEEMEEKGVQDKQE